MRYMLSLFTEEGGGEDMTPEQQKAIMDRWTAYGQEAVQSGAFVAGDGLQPSATATTVRIEEGSEPTLTDGPFAETKEQLGGFYLLECKDLDEALAWAKRIPFQKGAVEVRPVMDYEAMGVEGDPHAAQEPARQ
ncbi:MAG TPA: YciI family protein [Thermoleophilaceae bacterium]|nr:YciI family protein [Thermoleophilaceae bacterium]